MDRLAGGWLDSDGETAMTREQFVLALAHLRGLDGESPLQLPHGVLPGELPGGEAVTFTADTWEAYQWNPPGLVAYAVSDDTAGPKPTWAMLQAAAAPAELAQAQRRAVGELKTLCRHKITAAYGATSLNDEMLLRLRDGETTAQNTERDRLRGLFQTQKTAINGAATTAAVESLLTAARADSFWAPPGD